MENNVIHLTESELKQIINESVKQIIEEGFFDNMKSAYQGAKMAYQGQKMKDRGTDNFKQKWGRDELSAQANPWAAKPENTADMQAREVYQMYKKYQAEANRYLSLYNQLTRKYNLKKTGVGQVQAQGKSNLRGNGGVTANKNKFGSKIAGRNRTNDTNPIGLHGK